MFVDITRTLKPKPSYLEMLNLPYSAEHPAQGRASLQTQNVSI